MIYALESVFSTVFSLDLTNSSWLQVLSSFFATGVEPVWMNFYPITQQHSSLRTIELCHLLYALFALDVATPVEFALAAGLHDHDRFLHPSATAPAQSSATHALRFWHVLSLTSGALALRRARYAGRQVAYAVVWRWFHEYQLVPGDLDPGMRYGVPVPVFPLVPAGHERSVAVVLHLNRGFVSGLQVVRNLSKVLHPHPASLRGATARYAVALAQSAHVLPDHLEREKKEKLNQWANFVLSTIEPL